MEEALADADGVTREAGSNSNDLGMSGGAEADGTGETKGIGGIGKSSGARDGEDGVDTGDKQEDEVRAHVDIKDCADPVGTSELDPDAISRALDRYAGRLQRCYENQLEVDSEASGKAVIQFTIGKAGRVTRSRVQTRSVGGGVGECVVNTIRRIRFQKPKGGTVTVQKSFVFQAGE